jgi:hypothetical protein
MTVIFKNKSDEKRFELLKSLNVNGLLQDEGSQFSFILLDSELI